MGGYNAGMDENPYKAPSELPPTQQRMAPEDTWSGALQALLAFAMLVCLGSVLGALFH